MTESAAAGPGAVYEPTAKDIRMVIAASSAGTVFEWYDFFLYGILAALIGRLFFPIDNPTAATLASLPADARSVAAGAPYLTTSLREDSTHDQ